MASLALGSIQPALSFASSFLKFKSLSLCPRFTFSPLRSLLSICCSLCPSSDSLLPLPNPPAGDGDWISSAAAVAAAGSTSFLGSSTAKSANSKLRSQPQSVYSTLSPMPRPRTEGEIQEEEGSRCFWWTYSAMSFQLLYEVSWLILSTFLFRRTPFLQTGYGVTHSLIVSVIIGRIEKFWRTNFRWKVTVNSSVCTTPPTRVDPASDIIYVHGNVSPRNFFQLFILH